MRNNMQTKYRINTPYIVHDTLEGETILINLKNGNYYNIDKNGAVIWEIIDKNGTIDDFVECILTIFNLPYEQTKREIEIFISNLLMENLLVPVNAEFASPTSYGKEEIGQLIREKLTGYECPLVNKYSDMKDALMLDPIHDIDEKGWPTMNEEE